jgi:hypothetical protein
MASATRTRTRSAGISYQELIAGDAVPAPTVLRLENPYIGTLTSVSVERYRSRSYH